MRDAGVKMAWSRRRLTALAAVVWVAVLAASAAWNWYEDARTAFLFAETQARAAFQKDVVYRSWAALQGGVYVPPTETTPPNPYLAHLPHRDVVTTTGQPLTLVNPAYMTRQVHELGRLLFGAQGHITSLNPLRPQNAADAWEKAALESFNRGVQEVTSVEALGGRPHLRLMRPLVTEASCLTCHAAQGYKLGDIRGGISVSVPFEPYVREARRQQLLLLWGHLLVGAAGLVVLLGGSVLLGRSARALRGVDIRHGMLLDTAMDGLWVFDREGCLLEVNDTYCRMSGYTEDELLQMRVSDLEAEETPSETASRLQELIAKGHDQFETRHRRKDGTTFHAEVRAQFKRPEPGQPAFLVAFIRDVSERRQAEAERERLQTQLGQAQRLESVGRLAGGVAHDFNNMVGVIKGYTEMALARVPASDTLHGDLLEVKKAAERSADLTRQLLAFARQQTAAPRVLDLNDTIEGMLKMLRRLIGENIDLVWMPAPRLWPVRIDPAQVDQILANLSVNARDAVAGVGAITIETHNVVLDASFCADHPDSAPGEYVRLAVRDTGRGIAADVMPHLFEPFFTTKEVGEGTGLGLATVYGIVKQNNGFIDVESKPEHGATFSVYLPRHAGEVVASVAEPQAPAPIGGDETILLVEDEPGMLRMTAAALQHLGYRVLTAATPEEALRRAADAAGRIDLLLTDVVMPQMNGRDLADRMARNYPGVRSAFMSGYSAHIFGPQGILADDVHFIQKPFTVHELAGAVRRALDAE